jgi:hypothetical protein
MSVQIEYQKPHGASPGPEHVRAMVEWCDGEGLDAENIHSDYFTVLDNDGEKVAVFREFARDEQGHKYLAGEGAARQFAKTGWIVRPVASAPPAFVALGEVA